MKTQMPKNGKSLHTRAKFCLIYAEKLFCGSAPEGNDMLVGQNLYGLYIPAEASVVRLKFIEEQPQILRLTTPELKDVRGRFRSE